MFSIFKRKKRIEIPEWARIFNAQEYIQFINAIEVYFTKKNIAFELGNGILHLEENNSIGLSTLGLVNLAQSCKLSGEKNFKKYISEHFESLARSIEFEEELEKIVTDFEKVKEYVGVRIYPIEYISAIPRDQTIIKEIAGDIVRVLIFDFPDSIRNIQPELTEQWGMSIDDLFNYGTSNIENKYPFRVSENNLDGQIMFTVTEDHFFSPNIILNIENYPHLIGRYGSLIGIPHRHTVIIYPINDIEIIKGITNLIQIVRGLYNEGPGSISSNLHWYDGEGFEMLSCKNEDNSIQFYPTERFINLLNSLSNDTN
ncbi:MAG: hypothetical protein ACO1PI_00210 [Bacteroidota bacterium]